MSWQVFSQAYTIKTLFNLHNQPFDKTSQQPLWVWVFFLLNTSLHSLHTKPAEARGFCLFWTLDKIPHLLSSRDVQAAVSSQWWFWLWHHVENICKPVLIHSSLESWNRHLSTQWSKCKALQGCCLLKGVMTNRSKQPANTATTTNIAASKKYFWSIQQTRVHNNGLCWKTGWLSLNSVKVKFLLIF